MSDEVLAGPDSVRDTQIGDGIALEDQRLLGCEPERILERLPKRLSHGVLSWAKNAPNQPAIIGEKLKLSYGELAKCVTQAQQWLQSQGIVPGNRVMLIAENGPELMVMFLA